MTLAHIAGVPVEEWLMPVARDRARGIAVALASRAPPPAPNGS